MYDLLFVFLVPKCSTFCAAEKRRNEIAKFCVTEKKVPSSTLFTLGIVVAALENARLHSDLEYLFA